MILVGRPCLVHGRLFLRRHILFRVIFLNPCELNAMIAAVTNHLYTNLSREDFICLSIFLRELSKSMIGTSVFEELCGREEK